jgi:hypothetical protein
MAIRPANQLRQVYDVREGVIDLKIGAFDGDENLSTKIESCSGIGLLS